MPIIKSTVERIVEEKGYGVFFSFDYSEPALERYRGVSFICSLADNNTWDNCEMLLLPDNCVFNGSENTVSFYDRMRVLADIMKGIKSKCEKRELFIGTSGNEYGDFIIVYTNERDFPKSAEALLNTAFYDNDIHFIFCDERFS